MRCWWLLFQLLLTQLRHLLRMALGLKNVRHLLVLQLLMTK